MIDKEKAQAIRDKYMTMSYSIEPDGTRFPLNYKLYIERLEISLHDAEESVRQFGQQLDECQKKINEICSPDCSDLKDRNPLF